MTYSFVRNDGVRSVENVRDAESFQALLVERSLHAAQVDILSDLRGQDIVQVTAGFILIWMRQSRRHVDELVLVEQEYLQLIDALTRVGVRELFQFVAAHVENAQLVIGQFQQAVRQFTQLVAANVSVLEGCKLFHTRQTGHAVLAKQNELDRADRKQVFATSCCRNDENIINHNRT